MESDGSRVMLLFGFVLALVLCAVAGLAALSALGIFQQRAGVARPSPALPPPQPQSTLAPSTPTPIPTQAIAIEDQPPATQILPPTPTPIVVTVVPTQPAVPPTPTPTATPSPTPTWTATPTATWTPTPSPTPTNTPTPSPTPYAGPYREGNGVDLHALYAATPVRVDGRLDEWGASIGRDLNYIVSGSENYAGVSDIAGTIYAQWDTEYLYLAARIIDDVHAQSQRGERIDLGDGLIIWLDADLPGDFETEIANDDDYQIGLSPGDLATSSPEAVVWRPQRRTDWDQAILVSAHRVGDGYVLEAAIPWWLLDQQPAPGQAFGFSAELVDNDAPGTAGQDTVLSGTPYLRPGVPTSFGNLILERPTASAP